MELKQQCVSLELAKKLKELGVKQESLFYYTRLSDTPDGREDWVLKDFKFNTPVYECSAFTVAELGEMLPTHINKEKEKFYLHCTGSKGLKEWYVFYMSEEYYNPHLCSFLADTEVDARAKCLIYLLENNLIK